MLTSFMFDLSLPAAAFGPSLTTVPPTITKALKAHLALSAVPESGGYVFSAPHDPFEPLQPVQWTRLVQAMFKRYSGVALSPKDLRSSHVTWLKTGDHDDETVKAAAVAMRHSSKTQASAAYDKGSSDKRVSAAMKVAADYSSKFKSSSGASSSSSKQ